MLRFFTAGESHGPCLTTIVEGLPAGIPIDITKLNHDLSRRQQGYGRGRRMKIEKDAALTHCKKQGDTLGGVVEVAATGLPPGLGSFAQWDRKLDGRLGSALLSLQSAKVVEVGLGFATAKLPGSQVHNGIAFDHNTGFIRQSNNSGGTEAGMSTGEPLRVAEAVVANVLAQVFLEKFGGDSLAEITWNYEGYLEHVRQF